MAESSRADSSGVAPSPTQAALDVGPVPPCSVRSRTSLREVSHVDLLGVRVTLAFASAPATELSLDERRERGRLEGLPRLDGWLRGRAALKELCERFGLERDTSRLCFPHPRLSLTHGGAWAVAAGLASEADLERVAGVGVDLELDRPLSHEHARFFLTERERRLVTDAAERLRLWTVKEALFKADPDNHGTVVGSYESTEPGGHEGVAFSKGGRIFDYASHRVLGGWLTVAVCWRT